MSDTNFPDYTMIKAMALELGRPAKTLIALSDSRDPFYLTPARHAGAAWFAEIWAVIDPPDGVHLRRFHYRIVSLAERPSKLDGSLYQNTEHDWNLLSGASVDARALGLVDAGKFTDRRAGEPIFVADDRDEPGSGAMIGTPNMPSYAASKGAILSLTWSSAYELARFGINTNCVVPSAATRMSDSIYGDAQKLSDFPGETVRSDLATGTFRVRTESINVFNERRVPLISPVWL